MTHDPREALERIIQVYERNIGRQNEKLDDIPKIAREALTASPGEQKPPLAAGWDRAAEIVRLIDDLRSGEGDSVTILCDNPDFNGQPNCAVICNGDWTDWQDRRFAADTILDALCMASTEKQLPSARPVIAESNGHHWVQRFNLTCCRDCGIVRRADDSNSPCNGVVGVSLRREAPAPEGVASIVTCCVTGAIPGDGGACGDCDPCIMGEASVPEAVKRLIAEKAAFPEPHRRRARRTQRHLPRHRSGEVPTNGLRARANGGLAV